jgi:hypothetical protein
MHRYRILLQGKLDQSWGDWLGGLKFSHQADGTTVLEGTVGDQAALYGLLAKLRDLGITLLSVEKLEE